ncbi:MAG: restriction endonuclease [Terriglobia bacterium]|jgi:hypothetical protein
MTETSNNRYVENIRASGLTIYDPIRIGDPNLWIPTPALESLLNAGLQGLKVGGFPNRTRSKVVKAAICKALGYPVPTSFTKTKPRFPGQLFNTYTQKSNNLQVWNEELVPGTRYVVIRISEGQVLQRVKVVNGHTLSELDNTGTLTSKYQAQIICGAQPAELISASDTLTLRPALSPDVALRGLSPISNPNIGSVLPIAAVFTRLRSLIGASFPDRGYDQERRRGADLHRLVCQNLGYAAFADDGKFPDVRNQLLEVKLQTAPTIDLGLVCPDSQDPLDIPKLGASQVRHCDVRYALFYATRDGTIVTITHFFLTTGEAFFSRFPQFQGRVLNRKLQVRLPAEFFD